MPKVKCECGYIFNLSEDCPFNYSLIPEADIIALLLALDNGAITSAKAADMLDLHRRDVLICPKCGTVLIEEGNGPGYIPYERRPQKTSSRGENVYGDL